MNQAYPLPQGQGRLQTRQLKAMQPSTLCRRGWAPQCLLPSQGTPQMRPKEMAGGILCPENPDLQPGRPRSRPRQLTPAGLQPLLGGIVPQSCDQL